MKATPLTVQGKVEVYTGKRSSKVVYQSEALRPVLAQISRTAELATGLRMTGESLASENYQVTFWGRGLAYMLSDNELWPGWHYTGAH